MHQQNCGLAIANGKRLASLHNAICIALDRILPGVAFPRRKTGVAKIAYIQNRDQDGKESYQPHDVFSRSRFRIQFVCIASVVQSGFSIHLRQFICVYLFPSIYFRLLNSEPIAIKQGNMRHRYFNHSVLSVPLCFRTIHFRVRAGSRGSEHRAETLSNSSTRFAAPQDNPTNPSVCVQFAAELRKLP